MTDTTQTTTTTTDPYAWLDGFDDATADRPEYIPTAQAAELAGVTIRCVTYWATDHGVIRYQRRGRRLYLRTEDVLAQAKRKGKRRLPPGRTRYESQTTTPQTTEDAPQTAPTTTEPPDYQETAPEPSTAELDALRAELAKAHDTIRELTLAVEDLRAEKHEWVTRYEDLRSDIARRKERDAIILEAIRQERQTTLEVVEAACADADDWSALPPQAQSLISE